MENIIKENVRRKLRLESEYDPMRGIGCCGERREYDAARWDEGIVMLPAAMLRDTGFSHSMTVHQYREMRYRYDFEYWCYRCIKIHNKMTRRIETFVLNRAQRKMLSVLERQRCEGKPVRVILLKARQWGGSTLTQIYMAWWQLILFENCNSVICSHFKDTSAAIRSMYSRILENYPAEEMDT